mmetsp:Transcript_2027/g.4051  ORF Transcript_2027/g.4051 Transcript_2027/m.4051 type:complete len:181 (+) Transcript_2027:514-1056(+)
MGPGGDGVTNVLIKRLPDVALAYLAKLFHLLFAAGTCPDYWRKVLLFPISKGKEIVSALHLRPIALTAAVGKLFERVLHDSLMELVVQNGTISADQCGFLRGKSTMGPTTRIAQRLRELPCDRAIAGLFMDVKKAYNSVWHNGLIYKMVASGVPKCYTRWVSDWLRARRGVTSGFFPVCG